MASSSYTDLQTHRQCPRLFGFTKLGYQPIAKKEPLATGQLVRIALASHFRGSDPIHAITDESNRILAKLDRIQDAGEKVKAAVDLVMAGQRAGALVARYIAHWAKDYTATLVELALEVDGVICHPDLIATYQNQRVIVDFKTSYSPDVRWYDMSGQCDLYAYILEEGSHPGSPLISLIIYDTISKEGLYRHIRPPRLEVGKRLFQKIQELNKKVIIVDWLTPLMDDPHPDYTCPTRCPFFQACFLLETGSWEDCRDYLEENYHK